MASTDGINDAMQVPARTQRSSADDVREYAITQFEPNGFRLGLPFTVLVFDF